MRAKIPLVAGHAAPTSAAPSFGLTVGPEDDRFEREAQRMAERVVSPERSPLAVPVFAPAARAVQREAEEEDDEAAAPEEEGELQREVAAGAAPPPAPGGGPAGLGQPAPAGVAAGIARARGGGVGLPGPVRQRMEGAFRTDFSQVRVHTGGEADRLNRAVSARAFTLGRDVFFRAGAYQPGTAEGQRLLAHELTHVVQQRGGGGVIQREAVFIPGNLNAPYAHLDDVGPVTAGAGFKANQRAPILAANSAAALLLPPLPVIAPRYRSDGNAASLITKRDANVLLAEVDHIFPEARGGGNTPENAQILSSRENGQKSDTYPWTSALGVTYNGVRIYLPEQHSGVAAHSRLAVGGHGANALVRVPAGQTLATGATLHRAGTVLPIGTVLPAGAIVPAGMPLSQGAFGPTVLGVDEVLPFQYQLAGPLRDQGPVATLANGTALNTGFDLPSGFTVPAGFVVPAGFPLGLGATALGPLPLTAPVTLAAPHRLLGPIRAQGAISRSLTGVQLDTGTNLPAGFRVLANTTVPAGFPLSQLYLVPTTLSAPATLTAPALLAADMKLGADLPLTANLDLPAPVARLNGLMPANFYPP